MGWSSGLEQAKRICLQLAWEAFGAGSVPVGAVVLDGIGAVVASGRSRMYEPTAPAPELANSLLAHAEVNALVGLDPRRRYDDHALVTALEPCPLCIGALAMSTVGTLVYLAADPYGGAVGRLSDTAHTTRVKVETYGPSRDGLSTLISALHVACYLQRNPNGSVVRFHQDRHPDVVDAGSALLAAGASRQAQSRVPFGHIVDSLLAVVQPSDP